MADIAFNKKTRMMQSRHRTETTEPIELDYDANRERYILKILDPNLYPFSLVDPEAGYYEIKKTKNGRLQMTK